jgi:DNA mismatch repair ATPase MutS
MAFIKKATPTKQPALRLSRTKNLHFAKATFPGFSAAEVSIFSSNVVPSDNFSIDQEKLVLITGPNSGGKTAFCKTLTQIQLLAQIGSFVSADAVVLTQ